MNIALPIKVLRAALGISQKNLAQKAGVDKSYMSLIESGNRRPSMKTLENISNALGVAPHILMMMANASEADAEQVGTVILGLMSNGRTT
jgi:transcriptional regulator with XRE-family HTH domain